MTSRSVFIIDDADFVVDMLRLTFADGGYTVVGSATDSVQGVGQLREMASKSQAVDVVVVDLHMPKLDGFGTIREIREILPRAKIFLVSADAKELGVDGFIVKPFEPKTIWAALEKI